MNLSVTWDNEARTVIRYTFTGEAEADDLQAAHALTKAMLDSVGADNRVAIILDASFAPSGLRPATLARFESLLADLHPATGAVVLVSPPRSPLLQSLLKRLGGTRSLNNSRRMSFAGTLQEARRMALARVADSTAV